MAQELLAFWRGEITEEPPSEEQSEAIADEVAPQEEPAATIVPVEAGTTTEPTPEPIVDEVQIAASEADLRPAQDEAELSTGSESTPATEAVNPIGPSERPVPLTNYEATTDENGTQHGAG